MLEAYLCHIDVAEHLGVSHGTITPLAACYRVCGTADDLPHSGRSRVTMPVQDRYIRTSHLRYRFLPATSTAVVTPGQENDGINAQTVHNRLTDYDIRARHPYHGLWFDATMLMLQSPLGTSTPLLDTESLEYCVI